MKNVTQGTLTRITATFKNISGTLTDPGSITFNLRREADGVAYTLVYGASAIVKASTGVYYYDWDTTPESGFYTWRIVGTSPAAGVTQGQFYVIPAADTADTGTPAIPVGEPFVVLPNVKHFGAIGDGVTDDTTAFQSANAARPQEIYTPYGTYITTLDPLTGLLGKFWGDGTIVTSDGNKRGRIFMNLSAPLAQRGGTSARDTWFNGDVRSACYLPIELEITSPLVQTGSLTTNAQTTSGAVLHFASVPGWVSNGTGTGNFGGLLVTGTNIPANTVVLSVTSTTVTLSQNVSGTVSNGATIKFGFGQYLQPLEASPIYISVFAKQNTLNANQDSAGGSQNMTAISLNLINNAGGGLLGGIWVQNAIDRAYASYSSGAPYNTAAGVLYTGKIYSLVNKAYLTCIEVEANDFGFNAHSHMLVLDAQRTNAGSGADDFWTGIQFNFGACTTSMDKWFGGGGPSFSGADFTGGDFSANFNCAVAIKQDDRIYFKSTSNNQKAPTAGSFSIYYNSAADKIIISTGGANDFQFWHNSGSPVFLIGSGGAIIIGSTQVLGPRITGWGAGSNGSRAAFDGSTADLAATRAAVAQLIIDGRATGWIGT